MRPLTIGVLAIFVLVAAFTRLELLYGHKFFDVTGRAQWIWSPHRLSRGSPVAFFATRTFDLPPARLFTRIKILGDPEYTLYFNGNEIGGRRVGEEHALDLFDVSALARDRANRIVVAVRSPNGVGGLIASVDVAPELQNLIPTGAEWTIVRQRSPGLLQSDPAPAAVTAPMLLGSPPARRWNYLSRRDGVTSPAIREAVAPRDRFEVLTALPDIAVVGGVAVSTSRATPASVFDFGPVKGRARLTLHRDRNVAHNVNVRFSNSRADLLSIEGSVDPFVFAAGERTVVDPEAREFRYVMVYGSEASVDVVR